MVWPSIQPPAEIGSEARAPSGPVTRPSDAGLRTLSVLAINDSTEASAENASSFEAVWPAWQAPRNAHTIVTVVARAARFDVIETVRGTTFLTIGGEDRCLCLIIGS